MSDDNPYVIPEMDPTLRKQIQECNWQVVNITTPANYFHVLRRQVCTNQCLHSYEALSIFFLYYSYYHLGSCLTPCFYIFESECQGLSSGPLYYTGGYSLPLRNMLDQLLFS